MQDLFQNMQGSRNTPADLVAEKLEGLQKLSLKELQTEWRRHYRLEPPRRISRGLLIRAVAFKIQEQIHGGLKGPVKRKLKAMMASIDTGSDAKTPTATHLKPGIRLIREWQGKRYDVLVLENGFEFHGQTYRSLTAIAREITGAHWSGPRFFGLNKTTKASPELEEASQ